MLWSNPLTDVSVANSPTAPPLVTAADAADKMLTCDCNRLCKELDSFFLKKRVFDKTQTVNWTLTQNLPCNGKDTKFDALLTELGVLDHQACVSSRWLQFKKDRGIVPPHQSHTGQWT